MLMTTVRNVAKSCNDEPADIIESKFFMLKSVSSLLNLFYITNLNIF